MNSQTVYLISLTAVTAGVTILLRAFPFLAFGRTGKPPEIIRYLGEVISPGAMAMLAVYCFCLHFQDRSFSAAHGWNLPEIAAGLLVVGLHWWKRNSLLSIISGVVLYMVLIQKIFP
ncbi:MAG: AzlD domain-containing protein [Lentisphaeria bacterium]|nr:AzlD domain-containing protein [Lentisphaeria bacterium]